MQALGGEGVIEKAFWWVAAALATLVGIVYKSLTHKDDAMAQRIDELEKSKADVAELNRQRDNIGAIYRKLDEMQIRQNDQHVQLLTETHEAIKTVGDTLSAKLEAVTLERRRRPRNGD
jgi:flagellar motility protein MotE (MotC chaperone)